MTKEELKKLKINQSGFNENGVTYEKEDEYNYSLQAIIQFEDENGNLTPHAISIIKGTPTFQETREDIVESGIHLIGDVKIGKPTKDYPKPVQWK